MPRGVAPPATPSRLEAATAPWREAMAVSGMLLMFTASQFVALLLVRPFAAAGVRGFENPEDWRNGLWLLLIVFAFTALILYIARKKREKFIQALILASVGLTLVYVAFPLLEYMPVAALDAFYVSVGDLAIPVFPSLLLGLAVAGVLTWLLYRYPEWYIVDTVGILVAAGGIAIFGSSFTPVTYLVVLIGFAVYDYVSVYKTKHMLSLADSVLELHLPIMLVVPKSLDYSFLRERGQLRKEADRPPPRPKHGRDAMFLGLGDIVIPTIFAVTALQVSDGAAFGSFLGILAGFLFLMTFVLRGKPQAGLPSLNGGALLGFLIGLYWDTRSLVFW